MPPPQQAPVTSTQPVGACCSQSQQLRLPDQVWTLQVSLVRTMLLETRMQSCGSSACNDCNSSVRRKEPYKSSVRLNLAKVRLHSRWLHDCSNFSRFVTMTFLQIWHSELGMRQMQEWQPQLHLEWQRAPLQGQLHSKVVLSSLKGECPAAWTWYLQLLRSSLKRPPSQLKCP